jgi:hypothetical protein
VKFGGYPWRFLLAVQADRAAVLRELRKVNTRAHDCAATCVLDDSPLTTEHDDGGRVTFLKCNTAILHLPTTSLTAESVGVITHECFHVLNHYMDVAGMELSDDNGCQEAWAYALSDIVTQVVNVLGAHRADGRKIARRRGKRK